MLRNCLSHPPPLKKKGIVYLHEWFTLFCNFRSFTLSIHTSFFRFEACRMDMTCARNWARDPRGQNCTGTCVQYQQVGFDLAHLWLVAYITKGLLFFFYGLCCCCRQITVEIRQIQGFHSDKQNLGYGFHLSTTSFNPYWNISTVHGCLQWNFVQKSTVPRLHHGYQDVDNCGFYLNLSISFLEGLSWHLARTLILTPRILY